MKTEFIALSPMAAFALVLSGFLFAQGQVPMIAFGLLTLFVARQDSREPFENGTYQRGWFMWRKT